MKSKFRKSEISLDIGLELCKIFFESSHDLVESQEPSSHFESLVYKLESMSAQMKFNIFLCLFLLQNGIQPATKTPKELKKCAQCCLSNFYFRFLELIFL